MLWKSRGDKNTFQLYLWILPTLHQFLTVWYSHRNWNSNTYLHKQANLPTQILQELELPFSSETPKKFLSLKWRENKCNFILDTQHSTFKPSLREKIKTCNPSCYRHNCYNLLATLSDSLNTQNWINKEQQIFCFMKTSMFDQLVKSYRSLKRNCEISLPKLELEDPQIVNKILIKTWDKSIYFSRN